MLPTGFGECNVCICVRLSPYSETDPEEKYNILYDFNEVERLARKRAYVFGVVKIKSFKKFFS